MKKLASLVFGLFFLLGMAGSEKHQPNTLVVIEGADAGQMNPLFANSAPEFLYFGLILESLSGTGPNFSVIPWLARSWTHTPDGLHWTVNLERGVRWSDGMPFDSKDVVFTWKTMQDPKVGFPYAGQFAYIKKVMPLGPYRLRFDLAQTNALFESLALGSPILPEHILGKIPPERQRTSTFGQHPIGTGPYQLASWQHDSEAVFVRNPHWWHGTAKIPRIDFRIILDDQARVEAIENSSADLYDSMSAIDYEEIKHDAPHLHLLHLPDLFSIFVEPNLRRPGLSDLQVRRAMMYAWDREAITNGLLHGDAQEVNSIEPRALTHWYDPHVQGYPYDPRRAATILDAAGWRVGSDGVRRKNGVPLSFEMLLPAGQILAAEAAAEFQADMQAVGIAVAVKQLDYSTFIQRLNTLNFELAYTGWGGSSDPDEFTFLDSSQLAPIGNNLTGYKNPIVDRALRLGLTTLDPAKRRLAYNRVQEVTAQTLPVLWGYDEFYRAAYSSRLQLHPESALPDLSLWYDVYDWSLSPS
ncbi:MAG TPA: ABC transporter substrate-binding protein [Candidatus Baltobacteraceae bacterium]|jgi:peptide/nickel transport system substrate-binding protein|nr:ABC transporter substrate-binding protein [Candidatus Baltobacteraceae bacterium]